MRAKIQWFVITVCSCTGTSLAASIIGFSALGWPLSSANLAESAYYGIGYGLLGGIALGFAALPMKKELAIPLTVAGVIIVGTLVGILEFILVGGNAAV